MSETIDRNRAQRFARRAKSFLKADKGNVALMVTIALPLLILSAGGGADYMRLLAARSKLQAAVDSATLAAYKHYNAHPDATPDSLKSYFYNHLQASLLSRFEQDIKVDPANITITIDREAGRLYSKVSGTFPTTFIRLAGINTVNLGVEAEVQAKMSYTEVALVLDTTKSMSGSKLRELKRAATSFLENIYNKVQGTGDPESFKVAIVPFSEYVNVGMEHRYDPWINVPEDRDITGNVEVCSEWECTQWGTGESGQICIDGYHKPLDQCYTETRTIHVRWEGCVGSRTYDLNLKDEGYSIEPVPGVMTHKRNPQYPENSIEGWHDWDYNICSTPLTPLTSLLTNKDELIGKINSLEVKGWTYIPAGLVWGWRVLSDKEPFTQGADTTTIAQKNVRKIIILMTDGANTLSPSKEDWQWHADHGLEDPTDANRYTAELCNNIKEIDPATGKPHAEIITITFDVNDQSIKDLMRSCASIGSYDAASGQLSDVFDAIARKLVALHLSK